MNKIALQFVISSILLPSNNVIFIILIRNFICFKHSVGSCLNVTEKFNKVNFVILLQESCD